MFSGQKLGIFHVFRLYTIWGARTPDATNGTLAIGTMAPPTGGRTAGAQAGYQAAAIGITLVMAIVGGLFTG